MPLNDDDIDNVIIGDVKNITPSQGKQQQNFAKVGVASGLQDLTMAVVLRGVRENYEDNMKF